MFSGNQGGGADIEQAVGFYQFNSLNTSYLILSDGLKCGGNWCAAISHADDFADGVRRVQQGGQCGGHIADGIGLRLGHVDLNLAAGGGFLQSAGLQ